MIRQIVLDMGNVLLDYNPKAVLDAFCSTDEEKEVIYRELFQGPEWVQGDLGWIKDKGRYELVKARVPEKMHPALKRCANEWDFCMKPLPGAKDFCSYARKKGYGLYVLSNASDAFYEYFPNFAPLEDFDGIVVSCDLHVIKPDIRIYQHLLNAFHLIPEECLFIDDRKENVSGARAARMQGEVFYGDFEAVKRKYQL